MKKLVRRKFLVLSSLSLLLVLLVMQSVVAAELNEGTDWHAPVTYIKIVGYFILALSLFITLIPKGKELAHTYKKVFFLLFVIPIVIVSLYLAGYTVYENIVSDTQGPVHWHADYEVWLCGEKVDLVDPTGLKNKIGTPLFHEHNDDRIHIEGTVMNIEDIDLGSYFQVIGGELTDTSIAYEIEDVGPVRYENGDTCPDGNVGEVAVYVNGQRRMNPAEYIIAKEIFVPDGDCIIFEFGANLGETTEHICPSWFAKGMTYDKYYEQMEVNS